jgi:hypothetical protein
VRDDRALLGVEIVVAGVYPIPLIVIAKTAIPRQETLYVNIRADHIETRSRLAQC